MTICGFTISITKFDSWKKQLIHVAIHAGVALAVSFFYPLAGLVSALGLAFVIEIWDGFKKVNREGRQAEGFNIFPDLLFRAIGAALGFLLQRVICLIILMG